MTGYPKWFTSVLWWVSVLLLATGLLLIPTVLDMRLEWDVPWRLDGDQRVYVAAAHVVVAFVLIWITGALWTVHVRYGWRRRRNLLTGALLVGALVVLLLTAAGVLYAGDEALSLWSSLGHTILGLAGAGILAAHYVIGRSIKKADRKR